MPNEATHTHLTSVSGDVVAGGVRNRTDANRRFIIVQLRSSNTSTSLLERQASRSASYTLMLLLVIVTTVSAISAATLRNLARTGRKQGPLTE